VVDEYTQFTGQRARFLKHLAKTANITASAMVACITRRTAYNWKHAEPDFEEAWLDALEQATDTLEAEARRRALEGTPRPLTCKDGLIYDKDGKPVMVLDFSDTLMVTLLKAHRPERFKDRSETHMTGTLQVERTVFGGTHKAST
jgi:hypothetical protein